MSASTSTTAIPKSEVTALIHRVHHSKLLVRHLQQACLQYGLVKAGVKAELQNRLIEEIQRAANDNRTIDFYRLRQIIDEQIHGQRQPVQTGYAPVTQSTPTYSPGLSHQTPKPSSQNHISFNNMPATQHQPYYTGQFGHGHPRPPPRPSYHELEFKKSPFYELKHRVGDVRVCEMMEHNRHTVTINLKASDYDFLEPCANNQSYRIMVLCAADANGPQDITFPYQSELRVNGGEVKVNLRGLKNKPGSTRPADITELLRLRLSGYSNTVEFTYALTTKAGPSQVIPNRTQKYYLAIHLCKIARVSDLVMRIQTRKIPKDSVIREITKKARDSRDSEVEATSQVLSLKCPISFMRIQVPCRASTCTHIQCFDAESFLQLQQQGPQWLCPVCNKQAPFEQLAVDEYVTDILTNTTKDTEQVTIETDGIWKVISKKEETRSESNNPAFDDVDDFIISSVNTIGDRGLTTPSRALTSFGGSSAGPSEASRESSALPRGPGSISNKRPAPPVIDLTGSSDEDDEPITRPPKRQQLSYNGYTAPQAPYYYGSSSYM